MTDAKKRAVQQDVLFAALFLLGLVFLLWKRRFGFGGNDEAFYLTVPQRLWQGDALFRDEWHLSQMSGVLLLPFFALFRLFHASSQGILLAARLYYIVFHSITALLLYGRVRRYGMLSVFAVLPFYLFTPFDIMAYSYNSIGLDCVALAGVWLLTAEGKRLPAVYSGAALACAVLCCPYLAAVYVLFAGMTVLLRRKSTVFTTKNLLWLTVGILPVAAAFTVFLLLRTGIGAVIKALPLMLTDPEHLPTSLWTRVRGLLWPMAGFSGKFTLIPWILYILTVAGCVVCRKRAALRGGCFAAGCVSTALFYVAMLPQIAQKHYNLVTLPMALLGFVAFLLCAEKPKPLFALYCLGVLYGVALCFTSNQYYYVFTMALAVSDIASVLMIGVLLRQMPKKSVSVGFSAVFMLFLLCMLSGKAQHCFWETQPVRALDTRIESGVACGLRTTRENAHDYETVCADLAEYEQKTPGTLLVLSERTWCYIALPAFRNAAFSAWLSGVTDVTLDRLEQYYALNPEKIPQYIYIPKDEAVDLSRVLCTAQANGYTLTENDISFKLEKQRED